MKLGEPWRTLRHYLDHPLGRRDRTDTLTRFLRWQVGSRLLDAAVTMPFVDDTRLLVRTGMQDAIGNIYAGLMEFGFNPASYEPFSRRLTSLDHRQEAGNTLYVRSSSELEQRLRDALPVVWGKRQGFEDRRA